MIIRYSALLALATSICIIRAGNSLSDHGSNIRIRRQSNAEITKIVLERFNKKLRENLGGDIKAKEYTPKTGKSELIKCATDINCDFTKPCRWRNTRDDRDSIIKIFKGTGSPNNFMWQIVMMNGDQPESPFAMVGNRKSRKKIWFVSDEIPYQRAGATLRMRYWLSPLVQLAVCTRKKGSRKLRNCIERSSGTPNSPVDFTFEKEITKPFQFVIKIYHFATPVGGMAAFDNIKYQPEICYDSKSTEKKTKKPDTFREKEGPDNNREPSDDINRDVFGGSLKLRPLPSDVTRPGTLAEARRLDCKSFDRNCLWRNGGGSSMKFLKGEGTAVLGRLKEYSTASPAPASPFAFTVAKKDPVPSDRAILISDTVKCQQSGELSLRYWITGTTELWICQKFVGSNEPKNCASVHSGSPGPAYVAVKPSKKPFQIYIEATSFTKPTDFAIIDALYYLALLC